MADVFVANARRDSLVAQLVSAALVEAGLSVFRDAKMPPGAEWHTHIRREIEAAKCVVALGTTESYRSSEVRKEAEWALERGILVSILCDQVRPPPWWRGEAVVHWNDRSIDGLSMAVAAVRTVVAADSPGRRHRPSDFLPRFLRQLYLRYIRPRPGR